MRIQKDIITPQKHKLWKNNIDNIDYIKLFF